MKPDHGIRRTLIREWMALPKTQRRTLEQAAAFADKAKGRLNPRGEPADRIVTWLLPRLDRP